jgi:hypothetical protein
MRGEDGGGYRIRNGRHGKRPKRDGFGVVRSGTGCGAFGLPWAALYQKWLRGARKGLCRWQRPFAHDSYTDLVPYFAFVFVSGTGLSGTLLITCCDCIAAATWSKVRGGLMYAGVMFLLLSSEDIPTLT